jgi:hypothetical protein
MTVTAMLCFSEYYNGQWQGPKTSDVARSADISRLAQPPVDRSSLSVRPWRSADPTDEALYVQITNSTEEPWVYAGPYSPNAIAHWSSNPGFVLHNTHSAPVLQGDTDPVALTAAADIRALPPILGVGDPRTLSATYEARRFVIGPFGPQYDSLADIVVLTGHLPQRNVPAQPFGANQWDAPFFFEDARNVFYVTNWARIITFDKYRGYGLNAARVSDGTKITIPPLVLPPGPRQPGDPVESTSLLGDPALAERMLAGSQTIRALIGGQSSLSFDGEEIGPVGSANGALGEEALQ